MKQDLEYWVKYLNQEGTCRTIIPEISPNGVVKLTVDNIEVDPDLERELEPVIFGLFWERWRRP